MVPLRLTLHNFLSYREATLDFRGLHTACVCGANGAGKSSLLEAIAWAIWGSSRVTSDDDIIHAGMTEARVDFLFISQQCIYRVMRSRVRGQGTGLEFQVALEPASRLWPESFRRSAPETAETHAVSPPVALSVLELPSNSQAFSALTFRSLTAKGVRATQQLIVEHIKLDYETFVNSAYLRQGRADEFMLKRASDRKQILADLLKLNQYDGLAERAKDQARQLKGQIDLLQQNLVTIEAELQAHQMLTTTWAALETSLQTTQQAQTAAGERLQCLRELTQQQQTCQQALAWHEQQVRMVEQERQRLQQEQLAMDHHQQELLALLQQEAEIAAGYAHFQSLQAQEEVLTANFAAYQQLQQQQQQIQRQADQQALQFQHQIAQAEEQYQALEQQALEIEQILSKAPEVEAALNQLQQSRTRLAQLEQKQAQAAPLLKRQRQLQTQLDQVRARLIARLEETQTAIRQIQTQQAPPHLQQEVQHLSDRIHTLEQRRQYQEQIREKGLERRNFMERLQTEQRVYQAQLVKIEQSIRQLQSEIQKGCSDQSKVKGKRQKAKVKDRETGTYAQAPRISTMPLLEDWSETISASSARPESTPGVSLPPVCPLCDRPLDATHYQQVLAKQHAEQKDIRDRLWTIHEQLAVSERELQLLREEYQEVDYELAQYTAALERRGELQAQLQIAVDNQSHLQTLMATAAEIERSLQTQAYAFDQWQEWHLLEQQLQHLGYDERNHALARGEVDRWRWAEIRQVEIKQAQRKQAQLAQQRPALKAAIADLRQQQQASQQATQQQLAHLQQQLAATGYDPEQHQALRQQLKQAQFWQLRWQEISQAKQQYPLLQQKRQALSQQQQEWQQRLQNLQAEIHAQRQQLAEFPECCAEIEQIEAEMEQRRSQLDHQLAQLGRLQQQRYQVDTLITQKATLQQQLQQTQRQYQVYRELAQAFGKNGIQAHMIENLLPQLEAEANRILSRLSGSQLHIQFITQKAGRDQGAKAKGTSPKLSETLDILIADTRGTRPYETYSGGEAFRVNFAIRLALAKLLAQRAGTALQLLIIDEGFGTQDAEGCERLVAAINAIAPEFACILAITHVPQFKAAFQSRIEVVKTEQGSQLHLVS